MSSVVEICNMALAQIRSGSINSLEESSLQAQQCKLHYPIARDQVLKEAAWGFAHKITPLAELSSADIFGWSYVWQYPNDCLLINNVLRNWEDVAADTGYVAGSRLYDHRFRRPRDLPRVEYRVFHNDGNKVIVTNEAEARIDYRAKVTDSTLYPPHLIVTGKHC